MDKAWNLLRPPPGSFADSIGLDPFKAHLLYNRGIRHPSEIELFLSPDSRLLNDPMLLPDMELAVSRLKLALDSGETIGIFGDFDTDGITGTALLTSALTDLHANVVPYIPHRVEEGHGLNEHAIRQLQESGVSLLITVDCGATSVEEIAMAGSIGIDTIVTDHHILAPALPHACAVINPKRPESAYPYGELTGVGMAFKLVEALYADLGLPWPAHLLELVALGTVADVGPLTGENRFFVKMGLEQLNKTRNSGLRALIASARLKPGTLDTESLSFGLIPRLNGAGRLGSALISFELLTAPTDEIAESLASELSDKNTERQRLSEQSFDEAQRQIAPQMKNGNIPAILIVQSENWIPGILGLIASRLADRYYRPAIAITVGNEVSRASARSVPEFNMVEALAHSREAFTRFGGHAQAAGFTIPTRLLPDLKESMTELADRQLRDADLTPTLDIECEVSLGLFDRDTFNFIQSLSPFGEKNPAPVFLTKKARVVEARHVGAKSQHLKMKLWHSGRVFDAIAFRQGDKIGETHGDIDVVYTVGLNSWGSTPKLQLTVQDFRKAF